jgi:hypothetical protein
MFISEIYSSLIFVSSKVELAPLDDSAQATNRPSSQNIDCIDANENMNLVSNAHNTKRIHNDTRNRITARRTRKFMYVLLF